MISWGLDNGIQWNKKLSSYDFSDTGRGVITDSDISVGEILIEIPSKYLIHSKSKFSIDCLNNSIPAPNKNNKINDNNHQQQQQQQQSIYKPFLNCINTFNSKQRLSTILIIEKLLKQNSIWFDYINDLPNDYNITSNYDDVEISCLRYPIYIEKVNKLKNERISSWNRFKEIILENYKNDTDRVIYENDTVTIRVTDLINEQLYIWCWGTIQSRTYFYDRNMKGTTTGEQQDKDDCTLVPLADLFNHSLNVETESNFNELKDCYQVITKTSFKKDNQVFISYGKHSNFTLLNYYGFLIENNNQDSIPLHQDAAIPNCDDGDKVLYEKKLQILSTFGLSIYGENSKFLVSDIDKELPFSWNYLSVLKVLFMNKQEISNQLEFNLFHYDKPISRDNQEKVLNFLTNLSNSQFDFFNNAYSSIDQKCTVNSNYQNILYLLNRNIEIWKYCKHWLNDQYNLLNEIDNDDNSNNSNSYNNINSTTKSKQIKKKKKQIKK